MVHSLPDIPGFSIVEQLYLGVRTVVYRAIETASSRPVVIKILQQEYPSFNELLRFRNQYNITQNLAIPGIIHPYDLLIYRNSYALVMEDWGGISLEQYLQQQSLSFVESLQVALQLATILRDLYQHHIIHKDIKPANILIRPDSKEIKLIDFSIASALPKENQDIQNPNNLEGTLNYLAPEQTGRMNRGVDYRADFYALGVTLYELFTGQLPFVSADPLELIHCHIAKLPQPIHHIKPEIPDMVAAIVTRLMAKNAEDRYQTAVGLQQDLQHCLTQWQRTGTIEPFALGKFDFSDRFQIPEQLYGRQAEVETLLTAFDRVAAGSTEIMLVAGFSGVGKTAVINEIHKPIVRQRGYFIKGKFDQFNREIPLSAFVQALRHLMGQLLADSDEKLAVWQAKILAVVGDNGSVLIEVIPELEQIIGTQAIAPALSGSAAQNRFQLLLQQFIALFATPDHPLVIFLDDLQWADLASLQLLKLLMTEKGYLFIVGAYRDNEVTPTHPLMMTVADLRQAQVNIQTITLQPLLFTDINHLIADTLHCPSKLALPLTELVNQQAQGNPFFITQFLKALYEDGLIQFDGDRHCWGCDIAAIKTLSLTDDVVEFMVQQLQKLPPTIQEVLQFAACIGNQFDLDTLTLIAAGDRPTITQSLWAALQEELIVPTSQIYQFFQNDTVEIPTITATVNPSYRFLHDRIQQAAYALIPDDQRLAMHYRIGQLLLTQGTVTSQGQQLFEIVGHLNVSREMVQDRAEQLALVQLNLQAGRKAKAATAYYAAENYLQTAIALLPDHAWTEHYELCLTLHTEIAEAAYLNTAFDRMEQWVNLILDHAHSFFDTIPAQQIRLTGTKAKGLLLDALWMGLDIVRRLGLEFPLQPTPADIEQAFTETQSLWAGRSPLSLLDLPPMTEPEYLAAMDIMTALIPPAYRAMPAFLPLLACRQVQLSIRAGNCPVSVFAYADYGVLLSGILGDLEAGYAFGQLALQVLDRFHATTAKSRAGFIVHCFLNHWRSPLHDSLEPLRVAFQEGLAAGDLECVALNAHCYCNYAYLSGMELTHLAPQITAYREAIEPLKQGAILQFLEIVQQAVQNLIGTGATPWLLQGEYYDAAALMTRPEAQRDRTEFFHFHVHQMILAYFFGQIEQAAAQAQALEPYLDAGLAQFALALYTFYDALIQLAQYRNATPAEQTAILARVAPQQAKLQHWADLSPQNHQHHWDLVEAERQAILGDRILAIDYYDRAIVHAEAAGFTHELAIANERAALFYLAWQKETIARDYLTHAYYAYVHWGARAKVKDLEQRYPQLLAPMLQHQTTGISTTETVLLSDVFTSTFPIAETALPSPSSLPVPSRLDFASVLKASQTLSQEIELDKLLETLLRTVLENAGADKSVLLMPRGDQWFVEAIAHLDQPAQIASVEFNTCTAIPHSLINTVKRNLQPIVIVDAAFHPLLAGRPYITRHQPKSILCTPIVQQNKLVAILYLENQVITGAFTSDRLELLQILSSQVAISLENARLYQQVNQALQDIQYKEAQSRGIFEAASEGLLITDLETGQIIDANPAYCDLHGYDYQTLLTLNPYDFIPGDRRHNFDIFLTTVKAGQKFTYEASCYKSDGTPFYIEVNAVPFCYNGKICGLSVIRDISENKRMAQSIQEKNTRLEQALQELQSTQLQMVQNEKMATLGNLVAGVAHEINNPIGFLNGSLKNAQDYLQDLFDHLDFYQTQQPPNEAVLDHAEDVDLEFLLEDFPKLIDAMQGAMERIKSISTSLRTFSRADTEYKVSADLHEGIDSTLLILKYRLKANDHRPAIQVIKHYGQLPHLDCFPGQLNQVFMNIFANAIDVFDEAAQSTYYSDLKSNPQIITIQTLVTPESNIEIRITDNGKGMTEDIKTKIFDHLFTTKGVGAGTGLGLAIARQIIEEKHHGQIQVESTPNQGTTFTLVLPITPQ